MRATKPSGGFASLARSTFTAGVLSDIGSFGGLFRIEPGRYREPVLVASADGVGTKLKVAFMAARHDTVGVDLVNHCVNDILVQGAEPLFFLDYLATGRLAPDVAESIVGGHGARRAATTTARCSAARRRRCRVSTTTANTISPASSSASSIATRLINGRAIAVGDVLVGVPSSGLHTNGYSLARRIVFDTLKLGVDSYVPELQQTRRRRAARAAPLVPAGGAAAARRDAHQGDGAHYRRRNYRQPAAHSAARDGGGRSTRRRGRSRRSSRWLRQAGDVPIDDMMRTFNMGIGLIIVVAPRSGRAADQRAGGARWTRRPRHRRDRPGRAASRHLFKPVVNRRLGVLISGRGCNLQSLIDAIADGRLERHDCRGDLERRGRRRVSNAPVRPESRRSCSVIADGRPATTTIARLPASCRRATLASSAWPASCGSSARR